MHRPFVVLFQQDSAHEAEDGGFVGEDPDDIGAPLDLAIEALDGIVRIDLRPVVFREGGVPGKPLRLRRESWMPHLLCAPVAVIYPAEATND